MKVAFVKQVLDVFGPWSTILWKDTTPRALFDVWPGKATYWEMTCLLQADWYIVEQQLNTSYIRDAVLKHPGHEALVRENTTGALRVTDVPVQDYDVVITIDPILNKPRSQRTLFAYYLQEHWDALYGASVKKPLRGYDLFLAHMLDARPGPPALPQSVSVPYLRDPETMRAVFPGRKAESIWVDWRTLTALTETDVWTREADAAAKRLEQTFGLPVAFKGDFGQVRYGLSNPPAWGDSVKYLQEMADCKYYVSLGRWITGAGQALCDAASLGCLCIGEADKAFHRLICHPAGLCPDMVELPERVRRIASSPALQQEMRRFQEQALQEHFIHAPLAVLERAVALKQRKP